MVQKRSKEAQALQVGKKFLNLVQAAISSFHASEKKNQFSEIICTFRTSFEIM